MPRVADVQLQALLSRVAQLIGPEAPECHPKQQAFVDDTSPRKLALCTRRAGKTEGVAADLLGTAQRHPHGLSVYIARTRGLARITLEPRLRRIDRDTGVGLRWTTVDGQYYAQLPNGHRIWLVGCKDSSEIDKFRGPDYYKVVIDEAQSFPGWLSQLVDDALEPALLDHRGSLVLTGTPGPVPAGYFFDACHSDGWSAHRWSVLDNTFLPHAADWLASLMARNGWTEDTPTVQREWRGQWVLDLDALVYRYDGARNACRDVPEITDEWSVVIGVDLGYVDHTAFVVLAHRRGSATVHALEAWGREGLIPSAIAVEIEKLRARYPRARVVADAGGLGKGYVEEWRQRYGMPVEAAVKTQKAQAARMLSGDLQAGTLLVDPYRCAELIDDWMRIQWDPEDRTKIGDGARDHCADACLYAWRALQRHYRPEEEPPAPGSPEETEAGQQAHKAATLRAVQQKAREEWRRKGRRR